ncbi:alpha/beta fold hydrolase [Moritella sp. 24]|uniref:alpha/beta hydrolase family protein n=1 Tax=Moritella sp. 24 TaxID=2746230 RepID=UPI001BAA41AB|nr:alpha/beta fold hydrolase [Moritella sp. 24]QUM75896.1 alpha/beta fold hydrolase [Moritella sp. 24]
MMNTVEIKTTDGYQLAASEFIPTKCNGRVIIINGATGVLRKYYKPYAEFLCAQGFTLVTYDFRGIGDSKKASDNAKPASMVHWGQLDMDAVLTWAKAQYPTLKMSGVGHSIGGQLLGMTPDNNRYESFLNIAAQQIHWKNWVLKDQPLSVVFFFCVLPLFYGLNKGLPKWVLGSEYLPKNVIRDWSRFGRKPFYTDEQGNELHDGYHQYTGNMRFYAMADDNRFSPPSCVKALQRHFKNAPSDMVVVEPKQVGMKSIDHFGFFKRSMAESVWQETSDWLLSSS